MQDALMNRAGVARGIAGGSRGLLSRWRVRLRGTEVGGGGRRT